MPGGPSTTGQNVVTDYGYDALGRAIWTRVWDQGSVRSVTRTIWDASGSVAQTVANCTASSVPSTGACDTFDPAHAERNRATRYTYDSLGRQLTTTDPLTVTTHIDYDTLDRPYRYVQNYQPLLPADASTNVTTTLGYDAVSRVMTTTDPLGRLTVTRYDAASRGADVIQNYGDGNPASGPADQDLVSHTDYNALGLPIAVTANYVDGVWDPTHPAEDLRTVTQYDALNRPITVTEAYSTGVPGGDPGVDRITSYLYDAVGNRLGARDPLGRVLSTTVDALDRPVLQTANCTDGAGVPRWGTTCASGNGVQHDENITSTLGYTPRSEPATSTDVLGRVAHTYYDPLGRVSKRVLNEGGAVAPANVTTQYAYDVLGDTTVITDALGFTQTLTYNPVGWLTARTDATGKSWTYTYDGRGAQLGQIDGLGHEQHTLYDALARPFQAILNWAPGGSAPDQNLTAVTSYDAAGRQVGATSPDGRQTSYTLDGLDRLHTVTLNASGTLAPTNVPTSYGYDRLGHLTMITNALGYTQTRSYNAAGWLLQATDALGRPVTYSYDRAGRPVGQTDNRNLPVSTSYDARDAVLTMSAPSLVTVTLSYDAAGRRTSLSDETGATSYSSYDGLDHVGQVVQPGAGAIKYSYDALGQRTKISPTGGPAWAFGYDAAGRLSTLKRNGVQQVGATYDAVGRLHSLDRTFGAIGSMGTSYSYDGADRLTGLLSTFCSLQCVTASNFQYALNPIGQTSLVTETLGAATRTVNYGYDGLARVLTGTESAGSVYTYTYDLVGNRTSSAANGTTTNYTYDAADQVTNTGWSYDAAGNLRADATQVYTYNALSRLASVRAGITTTAYLYNGDGALAQETTAGTSTAYWLDTTGGLPERLGATTGGSTTWYTRGWGQELSQEVGGTQTWYLADRLGSVRGLVNSPAGLTASYNYDPLGTPEGAAPGDYGFAGEPQNSALGLVQLRARWYGTGPGRFLSRDPAAVTPANPFGADAYQYGNGDPVNNTDPTGWIASTGDERIGQGCPFVPSSSPLNSAERMAACSRAMEDYAASYAATDTQGRIWITCDQCPTQQDTLNFASGFTKEWWLNTGWLAPNNAQNALNPGAGENAAEGWGRLAADIFTGAQGVGEATGGLGGMAGGGAICITGVGCLAGAPAVVTGGAMALHGAGTVGKSIANACISADRLSTTMRSQSSGGGQGWSAALTEKVGQIRRQLKLGPKKRNVAWADYNIQGQAGELIANSGPSQRGTVGLPAHRIFRATPTADANDREADAELKIMEDLAHQFAPEEMGTFQVPDGHLPTVQQHPEVNGSIQLYSDFTGCSSCQDIVKQWEYMFPNVGVDFHWGPSAAER